MKKLLLALLIAFNFNIANAQKQSVVAVVNDEPITNLDIQKRVDLLVKSSGISVDSKTSKMMHDHVMYGLIDEKLVAHEAKDKKVEIDEADINFAMNSIAEKNGVSLANLEDFLSKRGINYSVLEEQIKSQLILNKYMRTMIAPKISVSDKEIEESKSTLIKAISKSKNKISQVKLSEIVLYPKYNKKDAELNIAEKLVSEANAGADFANLAKEFSDSSSAAAGGSIGWVYIDQIIPELANAVRNLERGQVSQAIKLKDGIHILKVEDIRYKNTALSEDVKVDDEQIRELLMNKKLDLQIKGLIRKLRRDGYVSFKK